MRFDLIQDLKLALFGKGYAEDDSHQRIVTGTGGLYTLRRDTLSCDASARNSKMSWN